MTREDRRPMPSSSKTFDSFAVLAAVLRRERNLAAALERAEDARDFGLVAHIHDLMKAA